MPDEILLPFPPYSRKLNNLHITQQEQTLVGKSRTTVANGRTVDAWARSQRKLSDVTGQEKPSRKRKLFLYFDCSSAYTSVYLITKIIQTVFLK